MGISVWQLLILLGVVFITLAPCVCALLSKKAKGWSKFAWFLLSFAFSWLGYLGYYFLVVRSSENTPAEYGRIHPKRP
jgi:bacteriorhodopsin